MTPTKEHMLPFLKAVVVGTLTGIVFGVVFLALPGAALLIAVGTMGWQWDLSWIPNVSTIMTIGGTIGGLFSALLFVKDRHIPYVEEVQDFEDD